VEAEAKIICAVRITLLGGAEIEVGCTGVILVSANTALQANSKAVLCRRVSLFSGQTTELCCTNRVFANAFAVLQATPEIKQRIGVRKCCGPSAIRNCAVNTWVQAAVYAIAVV
jgi:hypothetical protein